MGPAWIAQATAGKTVKDVCFVLRNATKYTAKMGTSARTLVGIARTATKQTLSAPAEWCVSLLTTAAGVDLSLKEVGQTLAEMRQRVAAEPDAVVLNIPAPYRIGVSSEALVAVVNNEIRKRGAR